MKRLALIAVIGLLAIAACDPAPRPEAVVVYATASDEAKLMKLFADFTEETGVPVTAIFADSVTNTDNVIGNRGVPPADVLLTSTVIDIWRAADEGALRPIQASAMAAVPAVLKDPDGLWVALDVRYAVIGVSPHVQVGRVSDLDGLAHAQLSGQLCLSSSTLPVNRTLMAMLIEDLGVRPAERMVRAWVKNLALAPFPAETELVAALQSGACGYGIFSSSIKSDSIKRISSKPLYIDINGVGVARHARQPESAHTLVNWMLEKNELRVPVSSNGRNIGLAGWRDEDAALLAERAGYR